MKILVLNCGSSSLKYQFINMENEELLAIGICERIGIDGSFLKHEVIKKDKIQINSPMENHTKAVQLIMDALLNEKHGVIKSVDEINAVGHRVVHGGEHFTQSVIIDKKVKDAIEECAALAPLHNPANLIGINACEELMPNVPQVAVFDTAFHQTMPEKAFHYAIPHRLYDEHKIRRYGFHGTSHKYVAQRAISMMGLDSNNSKIITCHLGNGASICAVKNGESVDTSMGLTPLEGLVMGTRSGDLDPAIIPFLVEKENLTVKEVENILNKKSGIYGLSGVSSDFRDVEDEAWNKNNNNAKIALEVFYYRVAKYIGSYTAVLNGVDGIVFTAGLGENSKEMRLAVIKYLEYLGVELDKEKNSIRGEEIEISTQDSKVKIFVIPTNEELVIARDTKELLDK